MNPINYNLLIQRIASILVGVSFVGLAFIITRIDPFEVFYWFWIVIGLIFIISSGAILLAIFWWFATIQKVVLNSPEVNTMIRRSLILGAGSTAWYIFYLTDNDTWNFFLVSIFLIMAYFWLTNER